MKLLAHVWTALVCAAWLSAAPEGARGASGLRQEGEEQAEAAPDGKPGADEQDGADEEEPDEWLAVVGGDVHTGTGAVLRGATLLAKNGVIDAIGYALHVPAEAERIDATGMRVYPGLVAINSQGLFGTNSDFAESIDPFNQQMTLALAGGITTAAQNHVPIKLKRFEIEDVVAGPSHLTQVAYTNRNPSSKSELRQKLARAAQYLRELRAAGGKAAEGEGAEAQGEEDKPAKGPSKKGVDEQALSILKGETLAYFGSANDRSELLDVARLAQEFGFRPVIAGCVEGWTVADELGRAGAYAIVTPRFRQDKDERYLRDGGSSIENAAILHRSGVQVAVIPGEEGISLTGIVGRDLMHLPVEAAFAVRGGLPEPAAFAAITLVPARILGIAHRAGTLELGKDCDLIVTDGDVLHYETFVQYAVVAGKLAYDKQEELFFAHIRPRPEVEIAPEQRVDPGEQPAAAEEPAAAEGEDGEQAQEQQGEDADEGEEGDEPPDDEGGEDETEDESKDEDEKEGDPEKDEGAGS